MWNPEKYQQAIMFAGEAHAGQLFPGSQASYVVHLAEGSIEILHACARAPGDWDVDLAMQCALLHDSIEDTKTTYDEVEVAFGAQVAKGVLALTKNDHLPKSEQMMDSLTRIRETGQPEVAMVKLADRITNLQSPPHYWDKVKIAHYREEARVILDQLGFASAFLAQRLKDKIDAYARFL